MTRQIAHGRPYRWISTGLSVVATATAATAAAVAAAVAVTTCLRQIWPTGVVEKNRKEKNEKIFAEINIRANIYLLINNEARRSVLLFFISLYFLFSFCFFYFLYIFIFSCPFISLFLHLFLLQSISLYQLRFTRAGKNL